MSRRVDQAYVVLTVSYRGETRDLGVWNGWDGGDASADGSKVRRGGTRNRRALGGAKDVENVTLTRDYDLARDHVNAHWLYQATGSARGVLKKFFLDDFDRPFGRPMVFTGVLVGTGVPGLDMESSDPGEISLEFSMDSDVG